MLVNNKKLSMFATIELHMEVTVFTSVVKVYDEYGHCSLNLKLLIFNGNTLVEMYRQSLNVAQGNKMIGHEILSQLVIKYCNHEYPIKTSVPSVYKLKGGTICLESILDTGLKLSKITTTSCGLQTVS